MYTGVHSPTKLHLALHCNVCALHWHCAEYLHLHVGSIFSYQFGAYTSYGILGVFKILVNFTIWDTLEIWKSLLATPFSKISLFAKCA